MDFNFGQPNYSLKPQYGNTVNMDFSNSDSSEFDFSGGSLTTAAPCTSFSAAMMQSAGSMDAMREAIFLAAAMHPVEVDVESLRTPPERKNVRLSTDPQSVAARQRRERINHRIRVLKRMVPGGMKMDTASMLDEAAHYLRFLKKQVELLEQGCAQDYRPVMGDAFFPGGGSF